MKEYKAIISFNHNNNVITKIYTKQEIKKAGKIQNLVLSQFYGVHRIIVKLWNEHTKKYYNSLTYDSYLEQIRDARNRVEIEWKKGFEDYTGFGNRTNGKKQRCYIGKSTGWIPCYLVILKSNSCGGWALLDIAIKNIHIIH